MASRTCRASCWSAWIRRRDTPEIIGKYIAHFGDDTLGVTGELSQIRKLTGALGIYFEKPDGR